MTSNGWQLSAVFERNELFAALFTCIGCPSTSRPRPPRIRIIIVPQHQDLAPLLRRNIGSLRRHKQEQEAKTSIHERLAQGATDLIGSVGSVYLHMLFVGLWIVANLGWIPSLKPWDPTFVVLAMIASVEALFLAIFILITQNRMAGINDQQDDLNLQINLLAEHEITKILTIVSEMAGKLGVEKPDNDEISELQREVKPEAVLQEIDKSQ